MAAILLFGLFFGFTFLGLPVAISLGVASLGSMLFASLPTVAIAQRMFTSLDSFPFMAIPFFMLAGKLMEQGGISKRLVRFANLLVGRIRGGLAMTCVAACAFFAALSGSAPGTVAAIGTVLYPEMKEENYGEEFSAGLIAVSGGLGPIIPPSIGMVTFGVTTGVSIINLFLGGMGAGVLLAVALMAVAYYISVKNGYGGKREKTDLKSKLKIFVMALPAIGMPILILGGIYSGKLTPTESACIAVFYSLFVGIYIYKEIRWKDVPRILEESAVSSTMILLIISTSAPFSWIIARLGLSNQILELIVTYISSPRAFLFITIIIVLIFGTFMEGNAIILLLMPLLYPASQTLGIDPIQYGVMVQLAIVVGCVTPPVAVNLFTAMAVTKLPLGRVVKGMMPFFITAVIMTVILALFPRITTFIPSILGA